MHNEIIDKLLDEYDFFTIKEIRSNQIGRDKGNVYLCIIKKKFLYVGITQNNLTQRILEHKRHPKTKFSKLLGECNQDESLWTVVERHNSKKKLSLAEKNWIKKVGSFGNDYGLNETSGGAGTSDYSHSLDSVAANSQRRKEFFSDPKNRRNQSFSNTEAHRLNPNIGMEHSKYMKERFSGEEGNIEREKTAEGMRNYLSKIDNLERHSWDRGARPFVAVSESGIQGFFLSASECAKKLEMNVSHISSALNGRRKSHKGNVFIYIKLGMTAHEILKISKEKFSDIE